MYRFVGIARGRAGRRLAVVAAVGAFVGCVVPVAAGATTTSGYGCKCQTTTTAPTTTEVTTTTAATTTTVGAVTTIASSTTRPRVTTTTFHEQRVTTTTTPSSTTMPLATTTLAVPPHLPFTGGDVFFPLMFGICCLAAGGLLLFRRSRGWRASS